MLKYTELIQQIECLMDDPTAAPMEKIAELANSYSEACDWVNEKTLFCVNTLRQGNASEALRLCRELDLLENYKTLVFDDYDAWLSAALTFGDVAIPAFNRRLIDELDAAVVCMQPIEEILKSHRILALSHSPLSVRIPVLRKLVELDPRNTGWKNELRDYEAARLESMYDELSGKLSYNECLGLLKEIEGAKWSVEIPLKIKKRIAIIKQEYQKKNRQKQIDKCNEKLNDIAEKLLQAYNNYDFEEAKRWRSSWFNVLNDFQSLQLIPPYDLIHSVDEVLNWIESEQKGRELLQEYNSKVASVDREMKRSISISKCQRLILDLTRVADAIGQPVPERFQKHLDKLIANEERKAARHNRFVTGIFTVILLFVIGGVSFGVYELFNWYRFNSLLDTLEKYEQEILKNPEKLLEAYEFVRNLEESGYPLAAYPKAQKSIAFIKKRYEDDKGRHEDWKLLYDKIKRSIEKGEAVSPEEIKELARLSIMPEEKADYGELERLNTGLLNDSIDAFVKKQYEKFNEIQQMASKLMSSEPVDIVKLSEIEKQLMHIRQSFADYAFDKPSLEKTAESFDLKCSDLLASVKKSINKLTTDTVMGDDLDKLALNMKSETGYVQGLQMMIDKYKDSSYAVDFKVIIQERKNWEQAYAWNGFINQNRTLLGGSNRSVIQLKDFITQWNELPFKPKELTTVKKINGRIPYFQSLVDCAPKEAIKPLKDLCYDYYRKPLWYYEEANGRRYYFNEQPKAGSLKPVNYMSNVSEPSDDSIVIPKTAAISEMNNRTLGLNIDRKLDMINGDSFKFTNYGILILESIYQDTTLRDPIVKYMFMMTALDCFSKSDKIIHDNFGDCIQTLDDKELKQCNPFNPARGFQFRKEAVRMMGRLTDFESRIETAKSLNESLSLSFVVEQLQPIGFLDKINSQWTVRGVPDDASGGMYIIKENELVQVGTVKDKVIKMQTINDGKRGNPVFLIKLFRP